MFEKMKAKTKYAVIPPMFIWGTLASNKACRVKSSVRVNVACGVGKVANKASEMKTDCKTKLEEMKSKREMKKEESKKETVDKKETETTETKPETETTTETENNNNNSVNMGVVYETEEPVQYGPDFSNLVEPVVEMKIEVESSAEELKPVTQEDVDEAVKKMRSNTVKIKGEE